MHPYSIITRLLRRIQDFTLLGLALSGAMILSACGSGAEQVGVQLQAVQSAPEAPPVEQADTINVAAAVDDPNAPPVDFLAAAPGNLLLLQGMDEDIGRIVRAPASAAAADNAQLTRLAPAVLTPTMWIVPNERGLIFAPPTTSFGQPNLVTYLDGVTGQSVLLIESRSRNWFVYSWSPRLDAALIDINSALYYVRLDGTHTAEIGGQNVFSAFWLEDGRVGVIENGEMDFGPNEPPTFAHDTLTISLYDPATRESSSVTFEVEAGAELEDSPQYRDMLTAEGITLVEDLPNTPVTSFSQWALVISPSENYVHTPAEDQGGAGSNPCMEWQIQHNYASEDGQMHGETLLSLPDVMRISEMRLDAEGRLVFLVWRMPECSITDTPEVSLMRLDPGEESETLVEGGIFPGLSIADWGRRWGGHPPRYALSPDGDFVAWISGGLTSGQSTLNLTHLPSGVTRPVLQLSAQGGDANTFITEIVLGGVYWMAS